MSVTKDDLTLNQELFSFIEQSPCAIWAANNLMDKLAEKGYRKLQETDDWDLQPGGAYAVQRNDSSVIAFRMPKEKAALPAGFRIVAAHCDSPSFKIKEMPEMEGNGYVRLNVEKYGGMLLSTWFDRPLSIAGRIFTKDGARHLVNVDRNLLMIPSLAIHMNREANKGKEYNVQTELLPVMGLVSQEEKEKKLVELIAEAAGIKPDETPSDEAPSDGETSDGATYDGVAYNGADLFLYNRDKGTFLGGEKEFIAAPRLDDLQCVFAAYKAFLTAGEPKPEPEDGRAGLKESETAAGWIPVLAVFDHEEVGSGSMQGADSTFLEDVLERIADGLQWSRSDWKRVLAGSMLLSADNAHAVHPAYPDKADPTNRPVIGSGVVLKFQAGQKYTTDGKSAAFVRSLCEKEKIPCQTYANRSDIAGGSTLGNISLSHVSVSAADIGCPQLAMHSAMEMAGTKDTGDMVRLMRAFWTN